MQLLLDTHIWLWSLLDPKLLSRRVVKELEKSDNGLWLSPISIWELQVLCRKGRVVLDDPFDVWVAKAMQAAPLTEAPVTHEVALQTGRIHLSHRDPADHFLAATAKVFGLTFVTADRRMIKLKDISVLANQ
ncbi:MAG TPA: type II toxin-antitoxin system VapC family toxin [Acidobacteriota bacterium]|jgi:PIN domain nuclease of toxin-antitoxin system